MREQYYVVLINDETNSILKSYGPLDNKEADNFQADHHHLPLGHSCRKLTSKEYHSWEPAN